MDRWKTELKDVASPHHGLGQNLEMSPLQDSSPIRHLMTCRHIEHALRPGWRVAHIGSGAGQYSELVARLGCSVYLVDISDRLLETARSRLQSAGLSKQLLGVELASATDLRFLPKAGFDAVLLLGPLSRLCDPEDRTLAVAEAIRLLRPGGCLMATGKSRMGYLRSLYQQTPDLAKEYQAFFEGFLIDGNLNPAVAPEVGFAHLFGPSEFQNLFRGRLKEWVLTGLESFTSPMPSRFHCLGQQEREAWLQIVERTGSTPEGIGCSDHFLLTGERP